MPSKRSASGGALHYSEDEKKEIMRTFLKAFKRTGNMSAACDKAGVRPRLIKRWLEADEKFRERFDDMQDTYMDSLEMEAHKRAMDKSDTLLLALLRAGRPKKFRENYKIEGEVKQQQTVQLVFSKDEWGDMPNYAVGGDHHVREETGENDRRDSGEESGSEG